MEGNNGGISRLMEGINGGLMEGNNGGITGLMEGNNGGNRELMEGTMEGLVDIVKSTEQCNSNKLHFLQRVEKQKNLLKQQLLVQDKKTLTSELPEKKED